MGKIDIKQMRKELRPGLKALGGLSYGAALSHFNGIKREELKDFKNNDVSKELDGGNTAEHKLQILDRGNLFSLLGFEEGSLPASELAEKLDKHITLDKRYSFVQQGNEVLYTFPVQTPTMEEIERATPAPGVPRSWVYEIEKGISGLAQYIFYKFFKGGRSKTGLQNKKKKGSSRASPIPYVSEFLKRINERFE